MGEAGVPAAGLEVVGEACREALAGARVDEAPRGLGAGDAGIEETLGAGVIGLGDAVGAVRSPAFSLCAV